MSLLPPPPMPSPPPPFPPSAACANESPTFTDAFGFACSGWRGLSCYAARAGYTAIDLADIRANCPICCGIAATVAQSNPFASDLVLRSPPPPSPPPPPPPPSPAPPPWLLDTPLSTIPFFSVVALAMVLGAASRLICQRNNRMLETLARSSRCAPHAKHSCAHPRLDLRAPSSQRLLTGPSAHRTSSPESRRTARASAPPTGTSLSSRQLDSRVPQASRAAEPLRDGRARTSHTDRAGRRACIRIRGRERQPDCQAEPGRERW